MVTTERFPAKGDPAEAAPLLETTDMTPAGNGIVCDPQRKSRFPPVRRLGLISFLIVTAMSMPNTSLLFLIRKMSCDGYYGSEVANDRCHLPAIEGLAASNIAKMGMVQTVCATIFVTQYWIGRFGTKVAMFQGSVWSAVRMLLQLYTMSVGGARGVTLILWAQTLCILGTPVGFMLAANSALMEMVTETERTAMFGVLTGASMAGYAIGQVGGGIIYKIVGLAGPFAAAFALLVAAVMLGLVIIPSNPPARQRKPSVLSAFRLLFGHGWTLPLLIVGVFLSVLATGYVPMAVQLVGQDVFGFEPDATSAMLFLNMVVRSVFLTVVFPRIIARGRAWVAPVIRLEVDDQDAGREPTFTPTAAFDIHFLRLSILVDAILTCAATLVRAPWQLFVASAILPLASGTGPAAKGVITELVGREHGQEALSAVALVESLAVVATMAVFGSGYAKLSTAGQPTLVFVANAAVALVAFVVLVPVRPPHAREHTS